MKKNHDCYKCIHRGTVAGDCHSQCHHPETGERSEGASLMGAAHGRFDPLIMMLLGKDGIAKGLQAKQKLGIKLNPHGVESGWASWPYNFDPVWVDECHGYEEKGEK